jgi:hypothetical protein
MPDYLQILDNVRENQSNHYCADCGAKGQYERSLICKLWASVVDISYFFNLWIHRK